MQEKSIEELPPKLIGPIKQTNFIIKSYLRVLGFIIYDTSRDPTYIDNHILSYLAQDYLQSAISIATLANDGLINVAKREIRFLLESSIKICFVQQGSYASTIHDKLDKYRKEISSHKISIKKNLNLNMLPDDLQSPFDDETGHIYSETSSYVHLTASQILERIEAVDAGRTSGKESAEDIEKLNSLLSRGLANTLVYLFHSVPDYVAGDWFVEEDGLTVNDYFMKSRFLAGMDSAFDYKHERQSHLCEIQTQRAANIEF